MSQRLLTLVPLFFLAGCSLAPTATSTTTQGVSIQGHVHGGQQPVAGAHVYLFAANTTGNAGGGISASSSNASISLLNAASTHNSDDLGAYVLTDAAGSFSVTGDYTCTAGQQVYLYALGGNTGAGTNSSAGFLSALGQCPASGSLASQVPNVWVDEVTTVVTAYALAGYATDATHISSDIAVLPANTSAIQATNGLANAFGNITQLVDIATGAARATNPAGTAVVPQALINTVADILAACVNASDAHPGICTTLLSNAKSSGATGTTPTDTATAAINIAHNPASNLSTLLGLMAATGAPYQPTLSPPDFTLALHYPGASQGAAQDVAIDSAGNAWVGNATTVLLISPTGTYLSGMTGYTSANFPYPVNSISIDTNDNAWLAGSGGFIFSVTPAGTFSPAYAIAGNGSHSYAIAVDGQDNVWIGNASTGNLYKYNTSGSPIAPTAGLSLGAASLGLAADASNRIWNNLFYYGETALITSADTLSATYAGSGQSTGYNLAMRPAIDSAGNYWVGSQTGNLVEISSTGSLLSGSSGYDLGSSYSLRSVSVDGSDNAWVVNGSSASSLFEINSAGVRVSPTAGYSPVAACSGMGNAIDGSGNVWMTCMTQGEGVYELIGAATPVVTPLSVAAKLGKIATRP